MCRTSIAHASTWRRFAAPSPWATVLVIGLLLSGCSSPTPPAGTTPRANAPATEPEGATVEAPAPVDPAPCALPSTPVLGVVLPLSGPMAARGNTMVRGIQLAADQVARFAFIGPDTTLELRIEDGAGDPAAAGDAVSTLLDAGVSAIVGPIDGRSLLAALPRASAAGVPVLVPSAAPTGGLERDDGVFHVAPFEAAIARAAVAAVAPSVEQGLVRLITVGDTPQAREAAQAMRTAAAEAGLRIDVEDEAKSPEALTEVMARLRAEPPALLLLADSPADHDMLLGALRRDAPAATTLVGGDAFNTGQPAPGDGDGVITADLWHRSSARPENDYFIADWREAYDTEPGADAVRAYSAVVLAAHAMRLVCSVEPQEVRFGFDAIRDAATPLGPWTFGPDGGPSQTPGALVWRTGERLPYTAPATAAP